MSQPGRRRHFLFVLLLCLPSLTVCEQLVSSNATGNSPFANSSGHQVCADQPFKCACVAVFLGLLIVCSIVGNSFVIAAIYLERSLQNVANYLIVSLACADLMVAIMVSKNLLKALSGSF